MTARRGRANPPADVEAEAAATRNAKASVEEAIGKLIGDDTAKARGTAAKAAAPDIDDT